MYHGITATGRRKSAVCVARIVKCLDHISENDRVLVNNKPLSGYFHSQIITDSIYRPIRLLENLGTNSEEQLSTLFRISIRAKGGGFSGQGDAAKLAIAKLLVKIFPQSSELKRLLRKEGLLTVDTRKHESKKFGLEASRRTKQRSKR